MVIRKVAVVDDDFQSREGFRFMLEDGGYEPFLVDGSHHSVSDLADFISERADAALCDHRLRHGGMADFDGAELVYQLQMRKCPAILISQYLHVDAATTVRSFRSLIPVAVTRADFEHENLAFLFEQAVAEIEGNRSKERTAHRSLVYISAISGEGTSKVADVFVVSWSPQDAVRIPYEVILRDIPDSEIKEGSSFLVDINIGAEDSDELYFSNFEIAPEPDQNDGLG